MQTNAELNETDPTTIWKHLPEPEARGAVPAD